VQIDHTVIDLIVVDERDRQPIGRPYLTLAIDVFTRCVVGMVVTLEAPSAVSVGLCLAHVACDKRPWLEGLDVEMDWPMSGKPSCSTWTTRPNSRARRCAVAASSMASGWTIARSGSRTMAASWNGSSARRCR
jgi:putative transposase